MAKQQMIPMPGGSGVVPKLIGMAVLIAVLVVVVKHPGDSANVVKALVGMGESVVDGIAAFLHKLAA